MYRWLRNTHLITGVFGFLFVLMYGLSAVQMVHREWFRSGSRVTQRSYKLLASLDARAAARDLMDRHGLRGEIEHVRDSSFSIARPGTVHRVRYDPATGETQVRTETPGFWGLINRLHHAHGIQHSDPIINVWGWLVAGISVAMVLLGMTGICMWFQNYKDRVAGAVILIVSLAWSLTAAYLMRTS